MPKGKELKLYNLMNNIVPCTVDDTKMIQMRVNSYLGKCDTEGKIATWKGVCVCLGVPSSTVKRWMEFNQGHASCQYLQMVKDIIADDLEQGALNGRYKGSSATFLLKSQHGYKEESNVTITHVSKDVKSFDELQSLVIDAEFSAK